MSITPDRLCAARTFLTALFGAEPEGYILLWTLPERRSRFFRGAAEAAEWAVQVSVTSDVYVGVGLRGQDHGSKRGGSADVTALTGLSVDLDIAGPGHKKGNLPPDEDAAWALVAELPLDPTLAVRTGGGLHLHWLFEELYTLETAEERAATEAVMAGWQRRLRDAARTRGWDVDSTWDLARVLRVPGTVNHKHTPPAPVQVALTGGSRYAGPSGFREYITAEPVTPKTERATGTGEPVQAGDLRLDPAAEPPFGKWLAAMEADPKFKQTWERKRKDMQDQSTSGYHMSLSSQAAALGWTDQEIVNLCIAWQRRHVEDVQKVLRPDYWLGSATRPGTLARAREPLVRARATARLAGESDEPLSPDDRDGLLAAVSDLLGIAVSGFIKHGSQRARYSLQLADGHEIAIGPVSAVLSLDRFRAQLYEGAAITLPVMKKERWLRIAEQLARAATEVENVEATREQTVMDWVQGYLASNNTLRDGTPEEYGEAIAASRPFVRDGVLFLHAPSLRKYVVLNQMEQIEVSDLHDALRAVGFASRQRFGRTRGGRGVKKWYWHCHEGRLGDTESATADTAFTAV